MILQYKFTQKKVTFHIHRKKSSQAVTSTDDMAIFSYKTLSAQRNRKNNLGGILVVTSYLQIPIQKVPVEK